MKDVKIYSTKTCPFCRKAKDLMEKEGVSYTEVDVTEDVDTRLKISEISGYRTVPQIFVDDKFIGGYTDVEALHKDGKFDDIFK